MQSKPVFCYEEKKNYLKLITPVASWKCAITLKVAGVCDICGIHKKLELPFHSLI